MDAKVQAMDAKEVLAAGSSSSSRLQDRVRQVLDASIDANPAGCPRDLPCRPRGSAGQVPVVMERKLPEAQKATRSVTWVQMPSGQPGDVELWFHPPDDDDDFKGLLQYAINHLESVAGASKAPGIDQLGCVGGNMASAAHMDPDMSYRVCVSRDPRALANSKANSKYSGVSAVGVGSNGQKRSRAASIGLILAIVSEFPHDFSIDALSDIHPLLATLSVEAANTRPRDRRRR